ncbi:MAG TPA: alcohol dehydrogenase catalytic domain-containing protein [Actinomycetota bacterium]|nr:alcohol dehydrogenase catalytic domain-containing protein [Actinomycetota bacterium]
MKAVVFDAPHSVLVTDVPRPRIQEPQDAIVKVSLSAICASDLHILDGKTPGMRDGCVIGHEFVGTIEELGDHASRHYEGERVVGSFLIACGTCSPCIDSRFNHCLNRRALGLGALTGDLEGAQAEYVRVPNADINLHTLDGALDELTDEQALFSGDILATGFYAAALSEIEPDRAVVVIGAGPVGLFCAAAAKRLGALPLLVLDQDPARVSFARERFGIEAIDVSGKDAEVEVREATFGRLADVVIEAVGSVDAFKSARRCTRDGGVVAVVGVYGAERYEFPMGRVWIRGLDLRFAGMANVQGHWEDALTAVAKGEVDPTAVITHRLPLDRAPEGYELFAAREAMKVVLTPT